MAIHYSVSLIKWPVISFSLIEREWQSLHFTHVSQHDSRYTQSYPYLSLCYEHVRRMSKYRRNHLRSHSDFRSRVSSISIVWVILVTILCSILIKVDRSNTLFSNMYYVSLIDITYPMICKTRSSHRVHTSLSLLSLPW